MRRKTTVLLFMGCPLLNHIHDGINHIYAAPSAHRQAVLPDTLATQMLVAIRSRHPHDNLFDALGQLRQATSTYRQCGTHPTTLLFILSRSYSIILLKNYIVAQDTMLTGD